jgi:hypothetical protein
VTLSAVLYSGLNHSLESLKGFISNVREIDIVEEQ